MKGSLEEWILSLFNKSKQDKINQSNIPVVEKRKSTTQLRYEKEMRDLYKLREPEVIKL